MPDPRPTQPPSMPEPLRIADGDTPLNRSGNGTPLDHTPLGAAAPATDSSDWPEVPGYTISKEIARGGMGVVYAARDQLLNRDVAIKTILPSLASSTRSAAQFDHEARLTALLPHPGVPPVHAIGTLADGRPFLAMKLIRGRTLAEELAAIDRVANRPRLLGIFEQVCQAVGYAHSVGVIHRDLKPSNVMVGAFGEVQVMDWGLAKAGFGIQETPSSEYESLVATQRRASECIGATMDGVWKGSPPYMAPEQALGEWGRVDARSDVFALGGILCDLLTGKPTYAREGFNAVMRQAGNADLSDALVRLDSCGADAELVALCKRCLSPDSTDRPADGWAVAEAMSAYRVGVEDRARRAESAQAAAEARAKEERKRRRVQVGLAIAYLVVGGLLAVGWVWNERDQKKKALAALEQQLKAENAREGVRKLLEIATQSRKDYRYGGSADVLIQAGNVAEQSAPDMLDAVNQAKADLEFVRELDRIRMYRSTWITEAGTTGRFATAKAPGEYWQAFAARGLDVVANPDAVAAQVAASAVRTDLVAALDDWAILEMDAAVRDKVLACVRRADPDPEANPFRNPTVWEDRAELERLAAKVNVSRMSVGTLVAVSELMSSRGANPVPMLQQAVSLHPRDFLVTFTLGQMLLGVDNSEALAAYWAARAIRPDNLSVLINLGETQRRTGNFDGAIATCRAAIHLDRKLAGAHNNLSIALLARAKKSRALITDTSEHNNLSNAQLAQLARGAKDDVNDAILASEEAIRLDGNLAAAHCNLGIAVFGRGDENRAIEAFEKALNLDENLAVAHYHLGVALLKRDEPGDARAALKCFKKAVELNDKLAAAHHDLGRMLLKGGDLDGAIASFEKATKADPKHVAALLYWGIAMCKRGAKLGSRDDQQQGVEAIERAIEADPALAAQTRDEWAPFLRKGK